MIVARISQTAFSSRQVGNGENGITDLVRREEGTGQPSQHAYSDTQSEISSDAMMSYPNDSVDRKVGFHQRKRRRRRVIPSQSWWQAFGSIMYEKDMDNSSQVISESEQSGDEYYVSYRLPSWFLNRVWELQANSARTGWNFKISASRIIPNKSPLFIYSGAPSDNAVANTQKLFEQHLASPFDVDNDGWTALHVSLCLISRDRGIDINNNPCSMPPGITIILCANSL